MPTPILQLPLVQPNQNQKEATINSALVILEAAGNDAQVVTVVANANQVLTQDGFTRRMMQRITGHTADITVRTPALKRFFVGANEGTGAVIFYPQGGTALANGAEVPAGKISLLMSDGVNIRALTSGVSRLQDLTDVITTPVADGQILSYVAAEERWRPATIAEVLNVGFVGLSDTPSSYSGQAGKIPCVNPEATGLVFVDPAALSPQAFTDLTDTPDDYLGQTGRVLVVNVDESGLIFQSLAELASGISISLNGVEVSNNSTAVDFKGLSVSLGEAGEAIVEAKLAGLTDMPLIAGQAGKAIVVNPTGDGFVLASGGGGGGGASTFTDLTDAPSAYTDAAGLAVRVKTDESGLEFVPNTLTALSDAPTSYSGAKGRKLVVKTDETGVEFSLDLLTIHASATASRTIVEDDINAVIPSAGVADIVLTLPSNADLPLPNGVQVTAYQRAAASKAVFAAAAGVTLLHTTDTLPSTRARYSTIMAIKVGTNEWLVTGDLTNT